MFRLTRDLCDLVLIFSYRITVILHSLQQCLFWKSLNKYIYQLCSKEPFVSQPAEQLKWGC